MISVVKQIAALAISVALCITPAFADRVVWRVQADPYGQADPTFTVFIGDEVTDDVTGETSVRYDTSYSIIVKRSELQSLDDLFNAQAMVARQTVVKDKARQDFLTSKAVRP